MAFVSIHFTPNDGGQVQNSVAEMRRPFDVIMSTMADTADDVLAGTGVPKQGDLFEPGSNMRCRRVGVDRDSDNPCMWRGVAEYASSVAQPGGNPLLAPARHRWAVQVSTEPAKKLYDPSTGAMKDVLTSAGAPFDSDLDAFIVTPVLIVERNESAFNPSTAIFYSGKLNSDIFYTAAPGQACIFGITGDEVLTDGGATFYWQVTYEIHFRADAWVREILDAGLVERRLTDGMIVPIELRSGDPSQPWKTPVTSPYPLDGAGHHIPEAQLQSTPKTYIPFQIAPRVPFAPLNL